MVQKNISIAAVIAAAIREFSKAVSLAKKVSDPGFVWKPYEPKK